VSLAVKPAARSNSTKVHTQSCQPLPQRLTTSKTALYRTLEDSGISVKVAGAEDDGSIGGWRGVVIAGGERGVAAGGEGGATAGGGGATTG
jgi:hypothetical protein